jgi:anti-sigma regulatory factor (Ser/Thr protein kinase)
MLTARSSFPPELRSVTDARRFLRTTLGSWGADAWEWAGSQVITELATNAVIHTRAQFDVEVNLRNDVLRLLVADTSPRLPVKRMHSAEATTGRGMTLIEALGQAWGIEERSAGKAVWCELIVDDATGHLGARGIRAAPRLRVTTSGQR